MAQRRKDLFGGIISLWLNKLKNVEQVAYKGKSCVVIPIDDNGIYTNDRGSIILSLFMSKMNKEEWGKTHELRRKLTTAEYKTMPKEERDKTPIIGHFEPWKQKDDGRQQAQQAQSAPRNENVQRPANSGRIDISSLPF